MITVPARPAEESVIRVEYGRVNEPARLIACKYYQVFSLTVQGGMHCVQDYPFLIMSVVSGSGTLDGEPLKMGDHLILPFGYGDMDLKGEMQLIASTVNTD